MVIGGKVLAAFAVESELPEQGDGNDNDDLPRW
jgi:hypothetical protein